MKLSILLCAILAFSSCGQIQRILDGTEKLPEKIDGMSGKMGIVNDATRLAVIAGAEEKLADPKLRANLAPVPYDMLPPGKVLAGALTSDETVLFFKNYISKLNNQSSADSVPVVDEETFQHNRVADYYMLMIVAGFLPDATLNEIIEKQQFQGGYQEEMFAILKLRADFNGDMMLVMSLLGLNPMEVDENGNFKVVRENYKLNTLGKIENALKYIEKVELIAKLDFADKIDLKIEGFPPNPLNQDKIKKYYSTTYERAQSDFKAQSLAKDPKANEAQTKDANAKYQVLLAKLKAKVEASKP